MSTGRDPQGMTRRQLMVHSAWFGAAVVLTVAGGEVISHVAGSAGAAQTQARPTLRFAQISDSHIGWHCQLEQSEGDFRRFAPAIRGLCG